MQIWTWVVAFLCLVLGWLIGRNNPRRKNSPVPQHLSKDYFIGLNYLLNEQPDAAVDVFIKMLEVDKNTVETHMALGSLFRKRGETNRAIRVHQNIIARPHLSKKIRLQALQELGRDYFAAGVYDRAERLFLEALETTGEHRTESLKYLLDIYEREKDWYAALDIAQQLQRNAGIEKPIAIAQYYCEIIEDPRNQLSIESVNDYLEKAFVADANCLRAGLIAARQHLQAGNADTAISLYQEWLYKELEFASLILPLLEQAYLATNNEKAFVDFLYKSLEKIPQPSVLVKIAEKLTSMHGATSAIQFLQQQLPEHASLPAIECLVKLQAEQLNDTDTRQQAVLLQRYLQKVNANKSRFQCEHCGYHGRRMHWLCPSCRRWGVVKPTEKE